MRNNKIKKFFSKAFAFCLCVILVFSLSLPVLPSPAYADIPILDQIITTVKEEIALRTDAFNAITDAGGMQEFWGTESAYAYYQIYDSFGGVFPQDINGYTINSAADLRDYCNASFALWFIYQDQGWENVTSAAIYEDAFKWLNQIASDIDGGGPVAALFGGMKWVAHKSDQYTTSYDDVYGRAIYTLDDTIGMSCPEMLAFSTIVPDDSYQGTSSYRSYQLLNKIRNSLAKNTYMGDMLAVVGYNFSTDPLKLKPPDWQPSDFTSLAQSVTWGNGKAVAKTVNTAVDTTTKITDGSYTGDDAVSTGKAVAGNTFTLILNEHVGIPLSESEKETVGQVGQLWYYGNLVYDTVNLYQPKGDAKERFWTNGGVDGSMF